MFPLTTKVTSLHNLTMKRLIVFMTTMMLILAMTVGCTIQSADRIAEPKKPGSGSNVESTKPEEKTPDKVAFEVVDSSDLSKEMQNWIEGLKQTKGFYILERRDDRLLVFIGSGEKISGGYGIEVEQVVMQDGHVLVTARETAPGKEDMVTMALTYPYTVIKISQSVDSLTVLDEDGSPFDAMEGPGAPGGEYADGIFDARTIEAGHQVGSMIVKEVEAVENKDSEYAARVAFSGIVTVKGTFKYYDKDETMGNQVAFYVDDEYAYLLPRLNIDTRTLWFVFENQAEAKAMLGEPGVEGPAGGVRGTGLLTLKLRCQ